MLPVPWAKAPAESSLTLSLTSPHLSPLAHSPRPGLALALLPAQPPPAPPDYCQSLLCAEQGLLQSVRSHTCFPVSPGARVLWVYERQVEDQVGFEAKVKAVGYILEPVLLNTIIFSPLEFL